jgi:hypothetical protein
LARVFLYAPIISYRSDFANLFQAVSVSLTTGLWTFPPSVCRPYQRQSKSKAKCTRGARPCLFLLSLILPGRRRTLNLQTHCLAGVARGGVRRATRSAVGLLLPAIIMQVLQTSKNFVHVFACQLVCLGLVLGFV